MDVFLSPSSPHLVTAPTAGSGRTRLDFFSRMELTMDLAKAHRVLNIPHGSSPQQIKSAFRKMAMKHHPDKGGDENKFKEINEAYDILTNGGGVGPPRTGPGDIFRDVQVSPAKKNTGNKTIIKNFDLTMIEAYTGVTKKISLQNQIKCEECCVECSTCAGNGIITIVERKRVGFATFHSSTTRTCNACGGRGHTVKRTHCSKCNNSRQQLKHKIIDISFKPRTRPGQYCIMKDVLPNYNLSVHVKFIAHEVFTLTPSGDLTHHVKLSLLESIFGKMVSVKHLSDEVVRFETSDLNVVINDNHEYKIPGKGYVDGKDLIFTFEVLRPSHNVNFQKVSVEDLAKCKQVLHKILSAG